MSNKTISYLIFDLDNTLLDAKQIHKDALNKALYEVDPKYIITEEEQNTVYEALPTKNKLILLTKYKNLPLDVYEQIYYFKQKYTIEKFNSLKKDARLISILSELKKDGYKMCVASNSIKQTIEVALDKLGISDYFDFYISNQDVKNAKPNCEMFLKCFIKFGCSPKECLILEDSPVGKKAALSSGAYLCPIENPDDVTYEKIKSYLNIYNSDRKEKYAGGAMNVVIPMAGKGSRFAQAGYTFPKPLIPINCMNGKPMIQMVVENLNIDAKFIYLVQKEHYEKYHLNTLLNLITPGCEIIQVNEVTEGAACTVLLAEKFINNDAPLCIVNSDQFLDWNSNEFFTFMQTENIEAGIATFESCHPMWSFAKLDSEGYIEKVAEKDPISNIANTGVHYFKTGKNFVTAAKRMIFNNIRVNNEFYVTPVLNELIKDGKKLKIFPIKQFFGTGTPETLKYFEENYKNI